MIAAHMRLSVVIPVYNEATTVARVLAAVSAVDVDKEVIVVDDGSTDGTRDVLAGIAEAPESRYVMLHHEHNQGKGAALRTGFKRATGEYVIIQDADLEYDPADYLTLLAAAEEHNADIVYGSRFMGSRPPMPFPNYVGNRVLTALTNLLFGCSLTDMETCFKLTRRHLLADLTIESNRFNVEPELTAKLLDTGRSIVEIPITYVGRTQSEGKKISWVDFVSAVATLVRYRWARTATAPRERIRGAAQRGPEPPA